MDDSHLNPGRLSSTVTGMDTATRDSKIVSAVTQEWQHLIDALRAHGAPDAAIWQTGGWCVAIGWSLNEHGACALLTSDYGPLEHQRDEEEAPAYMIGVYRHRDSADTDDTDYLFTVAGPTADATQDDRVAGHAIARARAIHDAQLNGGDA